MKKLRKNKFGIVILGLFILGSVLFWNEPQKGITDEVKIGDFSASMKAWLWSTGLDNMRTNMGLAIGTNIQTYSSALTSYAGVSPSGNVLSLLGAADYAAMKALLDLEIGTDVQAFSSILGTIAGLPAGTSKYFGYDVSGVLGLYTPAGAGDVVGPATATTYQIALFADNTGKLLSGGPLLSAGMRAWLLSTLAADMRKNMSAEIGVNVQGYSSVLAALAALVAGTNGIVGFNSAGTLGVYTQISLTDTVPFYNATSTDKKFHFDAQYVTSGQNRVYAVQDRDGMLVMGPSAYAIYLAGPTAARTYNIPDTDNDTFALLGGAQTFTGAKTFGDMVNSNVQAMYWKPNPAVSAVNGMMIPVTLGVAITTREYMVYFKSDGKVYPANANSSLTLPTFGILLDTGTADTTGKRVLLNGIYTLETANGTPWTTGQFLYMSDATEGLIKTTVPTTVDYYVQKIGIALGTNIIYIKPDWTLVQVK